MCKRCIVKSTKTLLLTVDCVSNHTKERYQVPRRKNFDSIFICSEITAQKGDQSVNLMVIHNATPFEVRQTI